MRKLLLEILGIIALCSLCFTGIVSATKAGYTLWNCAGNPTTVDGLVGTGEWDDSYKDFLYSGWTMTNSSYRIKYIVESGNYYDSWLIEVLSDTTNDTGDYLQICYDGALDGGKAPLSDDYLVNYTNSTVTVFKGTGTGWSTTTDRDVRINSTISASPSSATPHWIIEVEIFSSDWMNTGDRVAAYDASTGQTLMWPPYSSADVPDDYGLSSVKLGSIPEGLTIGVMVLLSSVAVIASIRYFPKHPKQ